MYGVISFNSMTTINRKPKGLLVPKYKGSSLNRKKSPLRKKIENEIITTTKDTSKNITADIQERTDISISESEEQIQPKERTLSPRTKTKIKNKIQAYFTVANQSLTFLTLTFQNKVEHKLAQKCLNTFLTAVRVATKREGKTFQYIWIAELQKNNWRFPNNIHFHIITNKVWNIKRYEALWLKIQNDKGIIHPEQKKASSSFDVEFINNVSKLKSYLTKYVTKNEEKLLCQNWNCSKEISSLFTSLSAHNNIIREYALTDVSFRHVDYRSGEEVILQSKKIENEFYTTYTIPNKKLLFKILTKMVEENRKVFKMTEKQRQEYHVPNFVVY